MLFGKKNTPTAQDVMEMIDKLTDEEKAELKIFLTGDADEKPEAEGAEDSDDEAEAEPETEETAEDADEAAEADPEDTDAEAATEEGDDGAEPETAEEQAAEDAALAELRKEVKGLHEAIKGIVARLDGEPGAKHEEEAGETEAADELDVMRKTFGAAMGDPGVTGSKPESDWEKAKNKYFPGI